MSSSTTYFEFEPMDVHTGPWDTNFRLLSGDALIDMEMPSYMVDPYLPKGGLVVLYGEPGTGKSLVALAWCLQVSHGLRSLLGGNLQDTSHKVLYLWGEGQSGISPRVKSAVDFYLPEHLSLSEQFAVLPVSFSVPDSAEAAELVSTVRENRVKLVVVDTLNRYMDGDENSQQDMGQFVRFCGALQAEGATVVVIHHSPKSNKKDMRGSSVLHGAADIGINMVKEGTHPNQYLKMLSMKDKEGPGFGEKELLFQAVEQEYYDIPSQWNPDGLYTKMGVALGLNDDPTAPQGPDWELRFAEYFSEFGPVVRNKTQLQTKDTRMQGRNADIISHWNRFANRGWICETDGGYEWTGPQSAKEL